MRKLELVALLLACSERPAPLPRARTAEEIVAPFFAVTLGTAVETLRGAHPQLVPTGWSDGTRATWIDPTVEAGLELETDGGMVRGVAVSFGPDRSNDAQKQLDERLGPGIVCTTLPEGITSFTPTLWRLEDGTAVMRLRKQRLLTVRVERPASTAFEEAWTSCAGKRRAKGQ